MLFLFLCHCSILSEIKLTTTTRYSEISREFDLRQYPWSSWKWDNWIKFSWFVISDSVPFRDKLVLLSHNNSTIHDNLNHLKCLLTWCTFTSTHRAWKNGVQFAEGIVNFFLISRKIPLKYVPLELVDNDLALVLVMAWRCTDDKPLSQAIAVVGADLFWMLLTDKYWNETSSEMKAFSKAQW